MKQEESVAVEQLSQDGALQPGQVTRQIADSIRAKILDGTLGVDTRLPTEDVLAEHYGVSIATIREALKRLAAQSLTRSRRGPGGGIFVNRPSFEQAREQIVGVAVLLSSMGSFSLVDIVEFRDDIGRICLRHAVQRRTNEELDALRSELKRLEDTSLSDVDFCRADVAFHGAIAKASGNSVYSFFVTGLLDALMPPANMVVFRFRDRMMICGFHRRILDAVWHRDAAAAEAAHDELIAYLRTKYTEAQEWRRAADTDQVSNPPSATS